MAERLDRAVVKALRDPARVSQRHRDLVDDLLAGVAERRRQAANQGLDFVRRQPDFLAAPFMRIGWIGRMPFAVDDADGDLALALRERVPAGVKMRAEQSCCLRQLGVVYPDLARPAHLAAGLDQRSITSLLLRRHLVIGDLGIAAKSRRVGHQAISSYRLIAGISCRSAGHMSMSRWSDRTIEHHHEPRAELSVDARA